MRRVAALVVMGTFMSSAAADLYSPSAAGAILFCPAALQPTEHCVQDGGDGCWVRTTGSSCSVPGAQRAWTVIVNEINTKAVQLQTQQDQKIKALEDKVNALSAALVEALARLKALE